MPLEANALKIPQDHPVALLRARQVFQVFFPEGLPLWMTLHDGQTPIKPLPAHFM
jgi:hypothetical protein